MYDVIFLIIPCFYLSLSFKTQDTILLDIRNINLSLATESYLKNI